MKYTSLKQFREKRDQGIIKLRNRGLTLDEIGLRFEISKEAVRKILLKYPDEIKKVDKGKK